MIAYLDDAVVLGHVVRSVRAEREAFTKWETGQGGEPRLLADE